MSVVFILLVSTVVAQENEPTQATYINISRVLMACGVSSASIRVDAEIERNLDAEDIRTIGSFEAGEHIDTPAEFVTAVFYSKHIPRRIEDHQILVEELSIGRMGGIRLGAMWLRKRIDDNQDYDKAIEYIKRKSELSDGDIQSYYRDALSAEVDEAALRIIGDSPRKRFTYGEAPSEKNAIDVLKNYYVEPTDSNYKELLTAVDALGKADQKIPANRVRFVQFVRIIEKLSPDLRKRIAKDIYK